MISAQVLPPKVIVECAAARKTFAPEVEAAIDAEWTKAQAANSTLFNGEVMTLERVETAADGTIAKLVGCFIDYRSLVASRQTPAIFGDALPMPLGVSAATFCNDGLICGQRGKASAFESGRWELAPGGTIDRAAVAHGRIDLAALILRELEEELGVSLARVVGTPQPFGFVLNRDPTALQAEIGIKIVLDLSKADVLDAFTNNPHREHSALAFLPTAEAKLFAQKLSPVVAESALLAEML